MMFYDILWDKEFAKVNRMVRDSHPYQIIKKEGKDIIIINALGVAEDDIKIDIRPSKYDDSTTYLYVEGETENEMSGSKYSITNRFTINRLKVDEITYHAEDGLLYIEVIYIEEPAINIPIRKKDSEENASTATI